MTRALGLIKVKLILGAWIKFSLALLQKTIVKEEEEEKGKKKK